MRRPRNSDQQAQEATEAAWNLVMAKRDPDFSRCCGGIQKLEDELYAKVKAWERAEDEDCARDSRDYPA